MSYNLDKTSAKILVLGDSGVGKTSLIHLICHSNVLSSAQWTIGCSIYVKLFGNNFLEFWDIGGSRGHKIARSFLYQDYHGIILVFDATNKKSRLNFNEWLREVSQKTNDKDLETNHSNITVPAVTIGTRRDLLPYGSLLEISDTSGNINDNCSVVDFDYNPKPQANTSYPYRRYQASNLSMSSSSSSSSFNSTSVHASGFDEPLLGNQVIYVNTQDALSFSPESKNYERLNMFFKNVVERRNKKYYNKFAI